MEPADVMRVILARDLAHVRCKKLAMAGFTGLCPEIVVEMGLCSCQVSLLSWLTAI